MHSDMTRENCFIWSVVLFYFANFYSRDYRQLFPIHLNNVGSERFCKTTDVDQVSWVSLDTNPLVRVRKWACFRLKVVDLSPHKSLEDVPMSRCKYEVMSHIETLYWTAVTCLAAASPTSWGDSQLTHVWHVQMWFAETLTASILFWRLSWQSGDGRCQSGGVLCSWLS